MIEELEVTVHKTEIGVVVEATGVIDLMTTKGLAVPLGEAILSTIADAKSAVLSLDFRGVSLIDAVGLALLVDARKQLSKAGCMLQVRLTRTSQLNRVLKIGRFDTIMELVYDSDELSPDIGL